MRLDLRRDYLNELGVPQWYARKRLSGARPSQEFVWPSALDQNAVVVRKMSEATLIEEPLASNMPPSQPGESVHVVPGQALNLVVSASKHDSMDEPVVSSASLDQDAQEGPLASSVDNRGDVPLAAGRAEGRQIESVSERIGLSLVAYRMGALLFVDESAVGVVDHSERELLQNIYFACCKEEYAVSDVAGFEWPVFSRMDAVASSGVNVDELLGRWFKSLLVEKAQTVVYHGRENQEHAQTMLSGSEGLGVKFVAFDYSLTDMINRPSLKANYWDFLYKHGLVVAD